MPAGAGQVNDCGVGRRAEANAGSASASERFGHWARHVGWDIRAAVQLQGFSAARCWRDVGEPSVIDIAHATKGRSCAVSGLTGLCCINELRDSFRESSMIARLHEQLGRYEVQDHELVGLQ